MKFSKESFSLLGLPDLLLNIWSYAHSGQRTEITLQYAKWCGELAAERWLEDEYLDCNFVMQNILNGNKNFCDFGKIASCDKETIYDIIGK